MNWTGKAYIIPRIQVKSVIERIELKSQCVYFLIGQNQDGAPTVYVGEAEEFIVRLKQHESKEWNYAIPFFSKDENLTKSHIKFLESSFYDKLQKAGRVHLENNALPNKPKLPEEDIADMELFQENVELILSTVGYNFFESPTSTLKKTDQSLVLSTNQDTLNITTKSKSSKKIFTCNGMFTNEGFVLLSGSHITINPAPSESKSVTRRRENEIEIGNLEPIIDENGVKYNLLVKDILFGSPSMAAAFALGYSINGWDIWKNRDGKTIGEAKKLNNTI